MSKNKEESEDLNVYEAACLVKMSPMLLQWFTSHAPKHNDETKLKSSGKISGVLTFSRAELVAFSQWLHQPWPASPKASRPGIPTGIKDEIVREAGATCAICHSHSETCEAAHIDPVHKSRDNHPHNLIWLCANHHTSYDKGVLGPKKDREDFVKALKETLLQYQLSLHAAYADAIKQAFYLLEAGKRASAAVPHDEEEAAAVEAIGEQIVSDVLKLTTKNKKRGTREKDSKRHQLFKKLFGITKRAEFANAASTTKRLHVLEEVHEEFQLAAGMVNCPLCRGEGVRLGEECPFCCGDRQVEKRFAENFESRDYELVPCPACKGKGHFGRYDECPECHGDCQIEDRFAAQISVSKYEIVNCPCCEGEGQRNSDDCPYCQGDGKVEAQHADAFDAHLYDDVPCDVCKGRGSTNRYEVCPKCDGEGNLSGQMNEIREKRNYQFVTCPECSGNGVLDEGDCPRCGGQGDVPRFTLDWN